MEEREVGRAHPFDRMRADRAGPIGDERALQEEAENVPLADGILPPRGNDRANRREQRFGVARDKRRQIAGRTVRREAFRDGLDRLDRQAGRVEVHARIAVHLQINPAAVHFVRPSIRSMNDSTAARSAGASRKRSVPSVSERRVANAVAGKIHTISRR